MKASKLRELLKDYPDTAIIAPKVYSEGMDGITLEIYAINQEIKRLGGIDLPFFPGFNRVAELGTKIDHRELRNAR